MPKTWRIASRASRSRAFPRPTSPRGTTSFCRRRRRSRGWCIRFPEPGGLGVHLTLDLAGQARFGPDVEWVERPDFTIDPRRAESFYAAIRRYWPGLPDGSLQPGYAGVRPKLSGPGEPAADFLIQGPDTHGVPGLVNLYGIESPGLTSSLAIAGHVADQIEAVVN
jgi:L-2-hydroxyglutarate oxidase LhgO